VALNLPKPEAKTVWPLRLAESIATGAVGGGLAWGVGSLIGLPVPAAISGAANGAISGWRWMYDWKGRGALALTLDSTWGLLGTTAGLLLNLANLPRPSAGYRFDLTYRQNHQVYAAGIALKRGYAFTVGNVISGAAGSIDFDDLEKSAGRRQFIKRHEALHVWQNRWFGPFYQIGYVGWLIGAGSVGVVAALVRREPLWPVVETFAYFNNPFEYWAYKNDDYWPPRDAHQAFVWGGSKSRIE